MEMKSLSDITSKSGDFRMIEKCNKKQWIEVIDFMETRCGFELIAVDEQCFYFKKIKERKR